MDILVVDDDDIAAEMLAKALEAAGHSVRMATNGIEALDVLAAEPVRLVISDWVMPEMNGLELCRQIRGGSFPAYIYIILLTSQDRPEDVVEGLSAPPDTLAAVTLTMEDPPIGETFRGQGFPLRVHWLPWGQWGQELVRWLLFTDGSLPVVDQEVVLWVASQ